AWTAFVKSCFTGFASNGREPNGSLLRSIFVTWLNSVPFIKPGQEFLEEMKQSAAMYQTHSLRIANQHYDKDAASEGKLRDLVEFCEAFAVRSKDWTEEQSLQEHAEDDNVDSDDEKFDAKEP